MRDALAPSPDLILEARDIVRRYPGQVALKGVTFRLHRNAVNVLIGENGAGKSTLMRILAGVEQPDAGQVFLDGRPVQIRSPREAAALGIAIVHQELATLPNLDVSDNVFAGRELLKRGGIVNRAEEDVRSLSALDRLRHALPLKRKLSQLSLGSRQIVELARVLAHGAKILILDEPTSALSDAETAALFAVIEKLKASGVSIVYISHRLHELLHLGDYFTVFRSGEVVGEAPRREVTREWIVDRMSDAGKHRSSARPQESAREAEVTLEVKNLSVLGSSGEEAAQSPVFEVSFRLHRGEILGIYGLLGSGRTELLETLAGKRRANTGSVELKGEKLRLHSVASAVKAGLVLVPEDRQRDGLIPELSVRENIALVASEGPMLSRTREIETVRALVRDLQMAVNDIELPVTALSGGNQQKVLLARCLMRSPVVLMMDEPTRGVDVGAKAEIYQTIRTLASRGLSVLFSSSEIEETRSLADRVLVLSQGRVSAEFAPAGLTDEALFSAASPRITAERGASRVGAFA